MVKFVASSSKPVAGTIIGMYPDAVFETEAEAVKVAGDMLATGEAKIVAAKGGYMVAIICDETGEIVGYV